MAYPVAQNDRVQDLFLLAKNHYDPHSGPHARPDRSEPMDRPEAARRIAAYHSMHDVSRMSWYDAAFVVAGEVLPLLQSAQGYGNLSDPGRLTKFLVDLQPHARRLYPDPHPAGYHADLIEALLSQLCSVQVRQGLRADGTPAPFGEASASHRWLMPFPECEPDPAVFALIRAADPRAVQFPGEAA
jgi:hypothetical protein